ncbi:hypothetical protein V5O48_011676 [Marasmius crinis-equi]|uniref:Uncharacterized protein n=1 Tax=Marasmius crinis-equi TaxID=585013 RepID=A0ABR3F4Z2_9AGAR
MTPPLPPGNVPASLEPDKERAMMSPSSSPSPSLPPRAQNTVPYLESGEGADWVEGGLKSGSSSPMVVDDKPLDENRDRGKVGEFGADMDNCNDQVDKALVASLAPFPTGVPVPHWFQPAFNTINVVMVWDYSELVRLWIVIEGLKGWQSPSKGLTARFRPQEVSNFMNKGRMRWEYGPQTGGSFVREFSSRVREWWKFLLKTSESEWKSLDKCGINGWCLLLICMKWWALGTMEMEDGTGKDESEKAWLLTLREMNKAAKELVDYLETM